MRFLALKLARIRKASAFGQVIHGQRGFDLHGAVDMRSPTCVYGWVRDANNPSRRIRVVAKSAEGEIAAAVADNYRSDLQAAAIGDGCYGFSLEFARTEPDLVRVEVAGLDIAIPNSAESEPLRTVNPNEAGQRSDDYGQLLKAS